MFRWLWAPIAWLFALILRIRHWLYDDHLLPSTAVRIPTICVGNLALGGTGKTPHVEYLVSLLKNNYQVAVLSRGYGRRTRGFLLADEESTSLSIGDEPMQIHYHFPNVPVAVCEDRVRGVKRLQKLYPNLDVIILDDAFQHRRIRSGLSILLTEYNNLYVNDDLLPVGGLRDLKSRALKADIVVVTKCPVKMLPIEQRVVSNTLKLAAFQHLTFSHVEYQPINVSGRVLVVTGIANPQPLLNHVKEHCTQMTSMCYVDHHVFTELDVNHILSEAKDCDYVLTTEKDMMRMMHTRLVDELGPRLVTQPISTILDNEFDRLVLRYVAESKRKNSLPVGAVRLQPVG